MFVRRAMQQRTIVAAGRYSSSTCRALFSSHRHQRVSATETHVPLRCHNCVMGAGRDHRVSTTRLLELPPRLQSTFFPRQQQTRFFSSTGRRKNNKQKNKKRNVDPRIQAKPPGEKIQFESKFPLPDKDKELELGRLQTEVQELYRAGSYSKAKPLAEELLKATRDHYGEDHPATAAAYNNVAVQLKQLGHFDESRMQYMAALKIYERAVGKDHASYASSLHNLGSLNRSQIHFDTSLTATDRLGLIEMAAEYLEEAYRIRLEERGPHHPHTVASRSGWGAALAAQILHHHKATETAATAQSRRRFYVSLLPERISEAAWEAAEEHLREALQTAVDHPRGPSMEKTVRKKGKKVKLPPKGVGDDNKNNEPSLLQTLSAAAAAQNLAVFLKARATTLPEEKVRSPGYKEAERLYRQVLTVQTALLPSSHPDMYVTKHSLAELLESMGEEEAANTVRQEIIDTYDPPEEKELKEFVEEAKADLEKKEQASP